MIERTPALAAPVSEHPWSRSHSPATIESERFHSWRMYHLVVPIDRSRAASGPGAGEARDDDKRTNVIVNPLQPPSGIAAVTPARSSAGPQPTIGWREVFARHDRRAPARPWLVTHFRTKQTSQDEIAPSLQFDISQRYQWRRSCLS